MLKRNRKKNGKRKIDKEKEKNTLKGKIFGENFLSFSFGFNCRLKIDERICIPFYSYADL